LDWWQGYWLLFRRSVPTLKSTFRSGSEARATTDIIHTDTTIRIVIITGRIIAATTTGPPIGMGVIAITIETIATITIATEAA
jgi:hypothetical protein